jgi:hypothetical protein
MHIRSPGFLSFKSTHTQIQRTLVQQLFVLFCFLLFLFCCGWVANKNMSLAILVLSSIPMNWTEFITIHKFSSIQFFPIFPWLVFFLVFCSELWIMDWIWETLILLLTFLSQQNHESPKKKRLNFVSILSCSCMHTQTSSFGFFYFTLDKCLESLYYSCFMHQWIDGSINFNPIQFNLFPFNCIHFHPIHHNELDEIQFNSTYFPLIAFISIQSTIMNWMKFNFFCFISIHSNPMNLILFISFYLNLV